MKHPAQDIRIGDFDYVLPQERIAAHPLAQRDRCKLLVCSKDGEPQEHIFSEIPELLDPNTTLVYNNTRVINARLRFRKDTGATIEIFCLEPHSPADYAVNFAATSSCCWTCIVGNAKRWKSGTLSLDISVNGQPCTLTAEIVETSDTARVIRFAWSGDFSFADIIGAAGEIPIPPYLNRPAEASDNTDYQTIYSRINGSVAAPTAGLHFTDKVLNDIAARGIPRLEVTLHVGAGTFRPVKSDTIADHDMHSEFIVVHRAVIEQLARITTSDKPSITAVGTTSVRTLESLYHIGCMIADGDFHGEVPQWYPYEQPHDLTASEALNAILDYLNASHSDTLVAQTRIIIVPGYRYRIVNAIITNFHQPKSTLLLLVSAFIGDKWRNLYDYALAHDFRFLSYGDACLFK